MQFIPCDLVAVYKVRSSSHLNLLNGVQPTGSGTEVVATSLCTLFLRGSRCILVVAQKVYTFFGLITSQVGRRFFFFLGAWTAWDISKRRLKHGALGRSLSLEPGNSIPGLR